MCWVGREALSGSSSRHVMGLAFASYAHAGEHGRSGLLGLGYRGISTASEGHRKNGHSGILCHRLRRVFSGVWADSLLDGFHSC